jgi:hypothetical protein
VCHGLYVQRACKYARAESLASSIKGVCRALSALAPHSPRSCMWCYTSFTGDVFKWHNAASCAGSSPLVFGKAMDESSLHTKNVHFIAFTELPDTSPHFCAVKRHPGHTGSCSLVRNCRDYHLDVQRFPSTPVSALVVRANAATSVGPYTQRDNVIDVCALWRDPAFYSSLDKRAGARCCVDHAALNVSRLMLCPPQFMCTLSWTQRRPCSD